MAPLVYYCRWQSVRLQLQGRDGHKVWGWLAPVNEEADRRIPFRFDTHTRKLIVGEGEHIEHLQLDEMGIVMPADA